MQTIRLHEKDFQSQHSAKCDLLIRLSRHRVSYAVIDQIQDKLKALFDAPAEQGPEIFLKNLFETDAFFNYHFRKVKVAAETSKYTFIPADIYAENQLPSYALFTGHTEQEYVHVNHIRSAKIRNIIAADSSLKAVISKKFPSAMLFSQAEPLIESFLKFYSKPFGLQLVLQVNDTTFEALLTDGRKLLFYNLFPNTSADEFNYFLLLIIRQSALTADTPVIIAGDMDEADDRYQRVKKYFTGVSFANSHIQIRLPQLTDEIPVHRYFSLIGINVCG